jgi:hypothetical protein
VKAEKRELSSHRFLYPVVPLSLPSRPYSTALPSLKRYEGRYEKVES